MSVYDRGDKLILEGNLAVTFPPDVHPYPCIDPDDLYHRPPSYEGVDERCLEWKDLARLNIRQFVHKESQCYRQDESLKSMPQKQGQFSSCFAMFLGALLSYEGVDEQCLELKDLSRFNTCDSYNENLPLMPQIQGQFSPSFAIIFEACLPTRGSTSIVLSGKTLTGSTYGSLSTRSCSATARQNESPKSMPQKQGQFSPCFAMICGALLSYQGVDQRCLKLKDLARFNIRQCDRCDENLQLILYIQGQFSPSFAIIFEALPSYKGVDEHCLEWKDFDRLNIRQFVHKESQCCKKDYGTKLMPLTIWYKDGSTYGSSSTKSHRATGTMDPNHGSPPSYKGVEERCSESKLLNLNLSTFISHKFLGRLDIQP